MGPPTVAYPKGMCHHRKCHSSPTLVWCKETIGRLLSKPKLDYTYDTLLGNRSRM